MNTNNLKKFAQEARKKLIAQVGAKLLFVLNTDSPVLREQADQVQQLRLALHHTTSELLIEKVAYTWFNRLMALRFMDANDYQPIGIRIITPKEGYTTPEILDEAKRGNISDELKLNHQRVYDLLDGKIPSSNPQNEAFKHLLIASCNHLNTVFPFLFERIDDYTELLLPDDLTSDFSIVTDICKGMPAEDCVNVEIIGWLYQFYISEKKDEVFASKSTIKKEDIPAATQLFTPRWIVEYMVQNTVGKLWLQNRPKSRIREHMPYFIESATMKSTEFLKVSSPEEIKLLDPTSGSGHILVCAFDLFALIYEEEGYSTSDIPKLIIENNLFGFEIDERASQLSGLALMMKAKEYQRKAFQKDIVPNILCFQDFELSENEIKEIFDSLQINFSEDLKHDLIIMQQATNLGSLILPNANKSEITKLLERLIKIKPNNDLFLSNAINSLQVAFTQLLNLSSKFHCVVANPPYMGSGNMNKELSQFVKTCYSDSKTDLMACFMESGLEMLKPLGFFGMINQHSWMFLSSFESLRKKLIQNTFFDTLLHLGARTFPEIGGEVVQNASFTFWKQNMNECGTYIRLVDENTSELKRKKTLEAIKNPNCGWSYISNQKNFEKIPSNPIGYWKSEKALKCFESFSTLGTDLITREGMATANNDRFMRFWAEVSNGDIGFDIKDSEKAIQSELKWFPYNKGGQFRRWKGNDFFVVNWKDDGKEIRNIKDTKSNRIRSHNYNGEFAFRMGITWSALSSSNFSARLTDQGFLFDSKGAKGFSNSNYEYILGLLNSKVSQSFLDVLAPTLDYKVGDIIEIPYAIERVEKINKSVCECIYISKKEWDSKETSWNFKKNELIRIKGLDLEETYDLYQQYWRNKFSQLQQNEGEINKQFIEIYDFLDELTPEVPLQEITILKDEINIDNDQLVFKANEVFAQFVSYAVGCMFGRYSLDKEGLILANQGETLQDYLQKIEKNSSECSFMPDDDNIIPVLEDEWFEDDITGRFYEFLKVTFGETNFTKNLTFVEEQLGKDIRKYFTKDFYPDHIKRYKKRPIYWMFTSPKGSFSVLIYMHRYTPDTISNILNKYLREFIGKLKTRKEHLQNIIINGSPSEKTKAIKENDNIDKMLLELQEYERDVLFPLASERISIDLDDGVLVNYNKFGKAVKEVAGLNDAATKKKVKEFDWIDRTQIR